MTPPRLSGILMTTLVHGAVVVSMVAFSQCHGAVDGPKIGQMVTIEAALAYKSKDSQSRQPQKPRRPRPAPAPTPETNPVSRDENQAPVEPKPPTPPDRAAPEEDFAEQFEKYRQQREQDEDESAEAEDGAGSDEDHAGGAFDGSEHGFAEVNKGDPYMRELAGQAHGFWSVPTLEQGSGHAVGCVQLGKDGRIIETQLLPPSQNATVDAAVKRALKQLTELREAEAKPVPAHLMEATTQWICFKFPY
jgi:type IV secretory pathway VirB10-like protein